MSLPTATSSTNIETTRIPAAVDNCVICLEKISERAITVPCNHVTFDFLCLISWLHQRNTCPLCNAEVTEVQYDWRSPTDFQSYAIERPIAPPKAPSQPIPSRRGQHQSASRLRHPSRPWGEARPPINPDAAIVGRRHVYRHKLYSLHVGSNRVSRYRDFTPELFARSTDMQSRARQWIRRELQVFAFLQPTGPEASEASQQTDNRPPRPSNAEFLLTYVIAILKTVDIKGSGGQATELIQDMLDRENAQLFLHELNSWLRSPYTRLADWDRHVQYTERLPGAPGNRLHSHTDAAPRNGAHNSKGG